jgi:hypothetical protein
MQTISFVPQPTMKINIHSQCSDFKLTDRRWFNNGADWNKKPDEKVDAGNMMSADLIPFMAAFKGVIMYELQREHVKSDDQPESTHIRFLVAWKSEGYKKFCVFIHLIEYDKGVNWNRIKLEEYYQRHSNRLSEYTGPIKDKWLMNDGTVLVTRLELNFTRRDSILNMIVSEGVRDGRIKKPEWIDPKA